MRCLELLIGLTYLCDSLFLRWVCHDDVCGVPLKKHLKVSEHLDYSIEFARKSSVCGCFFFLFLLHTLLAIIIGRIDQRANHCHTRAELYPARAHGQPNDVEILRSPQNLRFFHGQLTTCRLPKRGQARHSTSHQAKEVLLDSAVVAVIHLHCEGFWYINIIQYNSTYIYIFN